MPHRSRIFFLDLGTWESEIVHVNDPGLASKTGCGYLTASCTLRSSHNPPPAGQTFRVQKATLGSVLPRCFRMSAVWPCGGMLCTRDKTRYCVAQGILRGFFFFFLISTCFKVLMEYWNQNSNLGPSAQYLFPGYFFLSYFPHWIWSSPYSVFRFFLKQALK